MHGHDLPRDHHSKHLNRGQHAERSGGKTMSSFRFFRKPGDADTAPLVSQQEKQATPWDNRISESAVARILTLIATTPNRRETPKRGDLQGDFDVWFDGGAIRYHTGNTDYEFTDGSSAGISVTYCLFVGITFPNGVRVHVQQKDEVHYEKVIPMNPVEKVRHCLYCGGRYEEPDHTCKQCNKTRPFADESATVKICSCCNQYSLVIAQFCEWCGEPYSENPPGG